MNPFIFIIPALLPAGGAILIMIFDALSQMKGKKAGSLAGNYPDLRFPLNALHGIEERWTLERSAASASFFALSFLISVIFLVKNSAGGGGGASIGNSFVFDGLSICAFLVISFAGFITSLMSGGYFHELKADRGGFLPLIMFSASSAMILVSTSNFIIFFAGLEAMSLGAYALTGFRIVSPKSVEGSIKYFLLGSFASALLLYGIGLLYGETGSLEFTEIGNNLMNGNVASKPLVVLGSLLVVSGICFKMAAVPFHMWTPEAYEGAPTPATGFMATVVKSAAFVAGLRILGTVLKDPALAGPPFGWASILSIVCVVTMFWGNLAALKQKNIKRMLAYSSIAHAGYMLVGIVAGWVYPSIEARQQWVIPSAIKGSILYYLFTYISATAGAFAVVSIACKGGNEATAIEDYKGMAKKHPALALALTIFLLSLLGMPPLGGFFAKLYIFRLAVESKLWLLALLGMIASVISAYYYLGVIVEMYMKEMEEGIEGASAIKSRQMQVAIVVSVVAVFVLGIFPSPVLSLFSV